MLGVCERRLHVARGVEGACLRAAHGSDLWLASELGGREMYRIHCNARLHCSQHRSGGTKGRLNMLRSMKAVVKWSFN